MSAGRSSNSCGKRYRGEPEFCKLSSEISCRRRPVVTWLIILAIIICLCVGWYLICFHSWRAILGVPLLSESMILAAYLRHECAHLLAFRCKSKNVVLGEILSCITGDLSSPFTEYRKAHLRHHSEQVDLIGIDLLAILDKYPGFGRFAILMLEACYIPILFFIVRVDGISAALCLPGVGRARALVSSGSACAFYCTLAIIAPISLSLYISSIILKVHCIRFVDAFQHNYDRIPDEERAMPRGWFYEQQNTFSFPVLKRYRFLNLLLLNFGFHNAHHAVPNCPWYNLPQIDQALKENYPISDSIRPLSILREKIGIAVLLRSYHQNRINRIVRSEATVAVKSEVDLETKIFLGTFTDNLLG